MIVACPVNLECRVVHEFSIEHRQVFVGRVVQAHVDEAFVIQAEGKPKIAPMTDLRPILYALDNCYYSVGEKIGDGYQEGRKLRRK